MNRLTLNIKYICILVFGLVCAVPENTNAQRKNILTHGYMKRLESVNPKVIRTRARIESWAAERRFRIDYDTNIVIPVVFHILHNTEREKIDSAQVLSQLAALNRDFDVPQVTRLLKALDAFDLRKTIATPDMKFCLKEVQRGEPGGINYYSTNTQEWRMDNAMKDSEAGGVAPWNPDSVLNIWVVDLNRGNSGYAQMPGGPPQSDGIVIDYTFVGMSGTVKEPYHLGRTLTHLVGNYLGLHALWGERDCADDYCADTPIHNTANRGCPLFRHFSTCDGQSGEMVMNFMDATDDVCTQMFTHDQNLRMRIMLSPGGPRAGLLNDMAHCSDPPRSRIQAPALDDITDEVTGKILVYPNPVDLMLNIELITDLAADYKVSVYGSQGQLMHTWDSETDGNVSHQVDVANWPQGMYVVTLQSDGVLIGSTKIVVAPSN